MATVGPTHFSLIAAGLCSAQFTSTVAVYLGRTDARQVHEDSATWRSHGDRERLKFTCK